MAVEVKILKRKVPPEPSSQKPRTPWDRQHLARELGALLPADAFAFALPDEGDEGSSFDRLGMRNSAGLPGIIIVYRGRVLGLALGKPGHHLNDDERAIFPRLRAAGMRIEVARSFGEALDALREMGLELSSRQTLSRQVAQLFRTARREGA